jgi:hypothetical protein
MKYGGAGGSAPFAPVGFTPTSRTTPHWEPLYKYPKLSLLSLFSGMRSGAAEMIDQVMYKLQDSTGEIGKILLSKNEF